MAGGVTTRISLRVFRETQSRDSLFSDLWIQLKSGNYFVEVCRRATAVELDCNPQFYLRI